MPRAEGRIFRMPKILYLHMHTYSHRQHPQPHLWRMSCEPWRQTSIEKTGSSSTYKRNAPMGTHEGLTEVDKAQLRAWNEDRKQEKQRAKLPQHRPVAEDAVAPKPAPKRKNLC